MAYNAIALSLILFLLLAPPPEPSDKSPEPPATVPLIQPKTATSYGSEASSMPQDDEETTKGEDLSIDQRDQNLPPLKPGWLRLPPSAVKNALTIDEAGIHLDDPIKDFLGINPAEAENLNSMAQKLLSEVREIEVGSYEIIEDDSGAFFQIAALPQATANLSKELTERCREILGEYRGDVLSKLVTRSSPIIDLNQERQIAIIAQSNGDIYFQEGGTMMNLRNFSGPYEKGNPFWDALDRYSHIADFNGFVENEFLNSHQE